MATKPFSLQSPESIAKEYGGNKQKIAEAMQMGILDPTAGTLAGMFIDRMRSAQTQEQAPQQTVAQQVFNPQPPPMPPPPPGGVPGGPAAGLGAPQMPGAPPPGPPMGPPPGPPMGPPPGMAGGGLTTLPIPDAMFDEPDNGGYSGGGIVAFAQGGYGSTIEQRARSLFPNINVTSRQRSAANNARVGGVSGSYHLTGDARDFTPPPGMSMDALHAALKSKFPGYDVLNEGDHIHIEPGPGMARPGKGLGALAGGEGEDTLQGGDEPSPKAVSGVGIMAMANALNKKSAEEQEAEDTVRADLKKMASPEYQEAQKKQDMWMTLAQFGFNMASSKSPYILQAIADAAKVALPEAQASAKERKKALREAQLGLMELGARDRKDATAFFKEIILPVYTGERNLGLKERELDLTEQQVADTKSFNEARLGIEAAKAAEKTDYLSAVAAELEELRRTKPEVPIQQLQQEAYATVDARWGRGMGGTGGGAGAVSPAGVRANIEAGRGGGGGQEVVTLPPITPQ